MRRKPNKELNNYLIEFKGTKTVCELLPLVNKKFNETYKEQDLRRYLWRNRIPYKYFSPQKVHHNTTAKPIGSERTKDNGLVLVKVADNKWIDKQRYIYEQHYGVTLTENDFIVFKDGDRTNFDIDNLKCVSKYVASHLRNVSHNPETRHLEILTYELKVKTKDLEKKYLIKGGELNKNGKY